MIFWLIGPSGSGKTTVAPILADLTGSSSIDLDREIEEVTGTTISDLFQREGEKGFRAHETEAIRRLTSSIRPGEAVICATGAGAVETPHNIDLMRAHGIVIYLAVSESVAFRRLEGGEARPLLAAGSDRWMQLYERRREQYESADLRVDADRTGSEIADSIASQLDDQIHALWRRTFAPPGHHSTIEIYRNVGSLLMRLRELSGSETFAISELRVRDHYPHTFASCYGTRGGAAMTRSGELGKGFERVPELADRMLSAGISRNGTLVGFGGGVVTDLAGFLGSIYMRGIDTILIPTTLLAMVDAAIGGKTAVNSQRGIRNAIGTFAPPKAVLIAPQFLGSLDVRELQDGFVETLKTGIVADAELYALALSELPTISRGDIPGNILRIISTAVDAKLRVCERDLHDRDVRTGLNLGHTFAHAIESTSPGALSHGQAVALGVIAAANLAERQEGGARLSSGRAEGLRQVFTRFVPSRFRLNDAADVVGAMQSDKKRTTRGLRFVIPLEEDGGFDLLVDPPHDDVVAALHEAVIYSQANGQR